MMVLGAGMAVGVMVWEPWEDDGDGDGVALEPTATVTVVTPIPTATPTLTPTPTTTPTFTPIPRPTRPVITPVPTVAPLCQTQAPSNPYGYDFCFPGGFIYSPPADFCSYFACIGNFWNGRGHVIQCRDGMFSKSGGIRGSCSYHGGNQRALYSR